MTDKIRQIRFDELQEQILANAASVPDEQLIEFVLMENGRHFPRMVARKTESEAEQLSSSEMETQ
ncbi:MAG: hypothetical protein E6J34_14880 [Chloroflexi bacterium]|nr:MAG: hypothetical protein E6J34_14880 [Chloroflexota bacterium]